MTGYKLFQEMKMTGLPLFLEKKMTGPRLFWGFQISHFPLCRKMNFAPSLTLAYSKLPSSNNNKMQVIPIASNSIESLLSTIDIIF